jgi:metal-dependent HD superfamily phosphatase/phosphodiesterase
MLTKPVAPAPAETPITAEPAVIRIARAVDLVQGAGGMSGQDRNWYYHFWPDE